HPSRRAPASRAVRSHGRLNRAGGAGGGQEGRDRQDGRRDGSHVLPSILPVPSCPSCPSCPPSCPLLPSSSWQIQQVVIPPAIDPDAHVAAALEHLHFRRVGGWRGV